MRTRLEILAALATGRGTYTARRKGMRMGSVLSRKESFPAAHRESPARLTAVEELASATAQVLDRQRPLC